MAGRRDADTIAPMTTPRWDPIAEARQNWRDRGWTDAADGMSVVTSVIRVQQIVLARIDAVLKPYALSFARFELLRVLGFARDGGMSMSRLRSLLQVHPASVTNLVDRLEVDGLVTRSPNPDDGRSFLVELTAAGRELVENASVALNEQVFERLEFAEDELSALNGLLAGFRRRHGDFEDPQRPPDPL